MSSEGLQIHTSSCIEENNFNNNEINIPKEAEFIGKRKREASWKIIANNEMSEEHNRMKGVKIKDKKKSICDDEVGKRIMKTKQKSSQKKENTKFNLKEMEKELSTTEEMIVNLTMEIVENEQKLAKQQDDLHKTWNKNDERKTDEDGEGNDTNERKCRNYLNANYETDSATPQPAMFSTPKLSMQEEFDAEAEMIMEHQKELKEIVREQLNQITNKDMEMKVLCNHISQLKEEVEKLNEALEDQEEKLDKKELIIKEQQNEIKSKSDELRAIRLEV